MTRSLTFFLLTIAVCCLSCSKGSKSQNGPQKTATGVQIEILTGNAFADTIGKTIGINLKVTQNGAPLAGYTVYYHGSGCNDDHVDSSVTYLDGTTGYNLSLSGEVGRQTLGIYGLNAQHQKVDSITALGTGIAPGTGWHQSACTVFTTLNPWSYCKLSTGRVFASFNNGYGYLRYSDDNGRSWSAVKSLGNQHEIQFVMSTPADEIFAISDGAGTYYSNDAGQTWTTLAPQPFNNEGVLSAVYTPKGRILITTTGHPIYISSDKGSTWTQPPLTQFKPTRPVVTANGLDGDFNSSAEDQAGNLYLVGGASQTLYKSTDAGVTWVPQPDAFATINAFYIDNNNWFYKSVPDPTLGGLYISKDNGATYTQVFYTDGGVMYNLSMQSDGNIYYVWDNDLYVKKSASLQPGFLFRQNGVNFFQGHVPYILAKNGNVIVTNEYNSRIYYYQN